MEKPKRVVIKYYGELNMDFDKVLEEMMLASGYELGGSGYNLNNKVRDIEFIPIK